MAYPHPSSSSSLAAFGLAPLPPHSQPTFPYPQNPTSRQPTPPYGSSQTRRPRCPLCGTKRMSIRSAQLVCEQGHVQQGFRVEESQEEVMPMSFTTRRRASHRKRPTKKAHPSARSGLFEPE
ncbi:hypothetical protein IE53DRAFT_371406, partial [Violaceomyces palustris]